MQNPDPDRVRSGSRTVFPIGHAVRNGVVVHRRWRKALRGLGGFSHLIVVLWFDRARRSFPSVPLPGGGSVGFFATRTARRPNPIGVTVARLLGRRGGLLRLAGLDALEGTPVLDLKPYTPRDRVRRLRTPAWVSRLDAAEADPLRRYGRQLAAVEPAARRRRRPKVP